MLNVHRTVTFGQLSAPVQRRFRNLVDDRSVYTPVRNLPDDLIKEINDQLVDDIFNKAVINW